MSKSPRQKSGKKKKKKVKIERKRQNREEDKKKTQTETKDSSTCITWRDSHKVEVMCERKTHGLSM